MKIYLEINGKESSVTVNGINSASKDFVHAYATDDYTPDSLFTLIQGGVISSFTNIGGRYFCAFPMDKITFIED